MTKRILLSLVFMAAYIVASCVTRPWSPHYPTWIWYAGGVLVAGIMWWWIFDSREVIARDLNKPSYPSDCLLAQYQARIDNAVGLHEKRMETHKAKSIEMMKVKISNAEIWYDIQKSRGTNDLDPHFVECECDHD